MDPVLLRPRRPGEPAHGAGRRHSGRLMPASGGGAVIALGAVGVRREGTVVLDEVDWTVGPGERWVILGPNGSGKTTLLTLAGARLWPSAGSVEILGARLGR